ncbi:MAG: vanadium-dependent haloperoxidase [Gammaproteobacteria bacterium]|jgi:hypothetical protein|nr:vanadium-dependent haloperoxidase [Gammaproteobacteria bacterium]MBU0770880.1 vanadium-dependent haloperoxidase [Gammaproteobacteria bacterium]MBU0855393.1 vanadium-dependent haloperoxidase [Gammaproteobacteria bacterium]MBU1845480.1 vanadium-dependent haloperoxidase [Gammaproteobacteria bacterium]
MHELKSVRWRRLAGAGLVAWLVALPLAARALDGMQLAAGECGDMVARHDVTALFPVSAFHGWTQAEAQAGQILEAWRSEAPGLAWTRIQLAMHIKHKVSPERAARGLALMHVAMRDAWLAATQCGEDGALAQSMAAAQMLGYLFNAEERSFDRVVFALVALRDGQPRQTPADAARRALSLGHEIGRQFIAYATADGAQYGWNGVRLQWYGEGRYYGPGSWEPTPPYFYFPPSEPFAPNWRPWVKMDAAALRPVPPRYGSPDYLRDLEEVVRVQRELTPEQLAIARFWVDGHGSVTPSGHWNEIALDALKTARLSPTQTAELFADLNMAMADTFIAAWNVKYHYWTTRPVTAAQQLLGVTFTPAILTPPFPSYVSGHAATSGAAAGVLGHYLPAQRERFAGLAGQAAMSRLYGGIHFRHDNDDGLALGRTVAAGVVARRVAGVR